MSRYLNLVVDFVKRDIKKQYTGSVLGFTWVFLNPFFQIIIYTTIFGIFFKARPYVRQTEVPYVLFLCSALIPWNTFQATVSRTVNSFLEHAEYIKKLDLSKHLFLVYPVISSLVPFLSLFIMLILLFFAFSTHISLIGLLLYLLVYALMLCFLFGIALALSPMNVFVRDVSHFMPYVLQTFFWATPITYDTSVLPPWALELVRFNPLFYFVEAFRISLFGHPADVVSRYLPFCAFIAVISCFLGFYVYKSLSGWIADEL